jgi:hypothetical protein
MQKQFIPTVVASVVLLLLVWWVTRVESELTDLRQMFSQRELRSFAVRTSPEASSSSSSTDPASVSAAPSLALASRSFRSTPSISSKPSTIDEQVALKDRVVELEGIVEEIGQAWNQFVEQEERQRIKAQTLAWSPGQAVGAPDTEHEGDRPTAWASLDPDGGMEWLHTTYAQPVEVAQVRVRETFNPGAVVRITGVTATGAEVVLWQGDEPRLPAPADQTFNIRPGLVVGNVRVHLDTRKVPGWNEIDAVELVGRDGTRQWAKDASASSTYAHPGGGRAW